jgi:hypothetical protein
VGHGAEPDPGEVDRLLRLLGGLLLKRLPTLHEFLGHLLLKEAELSLHMRKEILGSFVLD